MTTKIITSLTLLLIFTYSGLAQKTLYDFTIKTIYGETFDLSTLKGKKVLIVNTASKCGLTPQYEDLQKLYETYKDQDFIILGFPANNFMNQEPGTNEEIKEFCDSKFGISFPMMEKISVKGEDIHPLYKWLTQKSLNGVFNADVSWNFQKFMINRDGKVVDFAPPREKPFSDRIVTWIQAD